MLDAGRCIYGRLGRQGMQGLLGIGNRRIDRVVCGSSRWTQIGYCQHPAGTWQAGYDNPHLPEDV
jgi:hypothetical protein